MNDHKIGQGWVSVLILLMFSLGLIIGLRWVQDEHSAAIKANAGHYDAKTGDFVYGCEVKP